MRQTVNINIGNPGVVKRTYRVRLFEDTHEPVYEHHQLVLQSRPADLHFPSLLIGILVRHGGKKLSECRSQASLTAQLNTGIFSNRWDVHTLATLTVGEDKAKTLDVRVQVVGLAP